MTCSEVAIHHFWKSDQMSCAKTKNELQQFADFEGHDLKEKFLHISFLFRLNFSLLVA